MNNDDNKKNITDGVSYFKESDFLKKKGNLYLFKVFGLSILLFFIAGSILSIHQDGAISYFLSLISSVLIINGYDNAKK